MKTKIFIGLVVFFLVVLIVGGIWFFGKKSTPSSLSFIVTHVNYLCENNKTISADFYKSESKPVQPGEMPHPSGKVKLSLSDGRKFELAQTISADGGRYANEDESFIFWSKGNGAIVLENNIEKDYKGCIVVSPDLGAVPNTYLNSKLGFTIRYPKEYLVDTNYKYQALGPGKEIEGVKFIIPGSFATGTNLSSFDTGVSVEEIKDVSDCNASLFLGGNVKPQMIKDNNVEYSFASSTDAGAGNRYEEQVWAFPETNPCLAIRYFIHYTVLENYPKGSISEFNRNALINQFDQIRRSFIQL